jgi:hypothetical protein
MTSACANYSPPRPVVALPQILDNPDNRRPRFFSSLHVRAVLDLGGHTAVHCLDNPFKEQVEQTLRIEFAVVPIEQHPDLVGVDPRREVRSGASKVLIKQKHSTAHLLLSSRTAPVPEDSLLVYSTISPVTSVCGLLSTDQTPSYIFFCPDSFFFSLSGHFPHTLYF